MLERVGQRLLHDPVDAKTHGSGQAGELAAQVQAHRHADHAHLLDQLRQCGHVGLRRAGVTFIGVAAQHVQQRAQFDQGFAAGGGDGAHRGLGQVRVGADGVARAVGLHHDDTHRVRDHVVQLPGDPGALGGHRDGGLLVAFGLQQAKPALHLVVVGAAGADELAEHPAEAVDRQRAEAEHQRDVAVGVDPPGQVDRGPAQQPRIGHGPAAFRISDQGVERDAEGQVGNPDRLGRVVGHAAVGEQLDRRACHDQIGGQNGPTTLEDERHHHQHGDRPVILRKLQCEALRALGQGEQGEDQRDHRVPEDRVPAHPQAQPPHSARVGSGRTSARQPLVVRAVPRRDHPRGTIRR